MPGTRKYRYVAFICTQAISKRAKRVMYKSIEESIVHRTEVWDTSKINRALNMLRNDEITRQTGVGIGIIESTKVKQVKWPFKLNVLSKMVQVNMEKNIHTKKKKVDVKCHKGGA